LAEGAYTDSNRSHPARYSTFSSFSNSPSPVKTCFDGASPHPSGARGVAPREWRFRATREIETLVPYERSRGCCPPPYKL
jgi:hypothetical protein